MFNTQRINPALEDFQLAKRRTLGLVGASAAMVLALTGLSQYAVGAVQNAAHPAKKSAASQQPLTIVPSPIGNFQDNFNPFSPSPNHGTVGLIYQPLVYFDNISPHVFPLLGFSHQHHREQSALDSGRRRHSHTHFRHRWYICRHPDLLATRRRSRSHDPHCNNVSPGDSL